MRTILSGFEPERFSELYRNQIREIAPDIRLLVTKDRKEMEEVIDDIEIPISEHIFALLLAPGRRIGVSVRAQMHADRLFDVLPKADFVVITAPLTEKTRGMIGERELRAMKPAVHIVNISRGGIIDEGALIQALQEGWIAGAGLDVFEKEPLLKDSPLWKIENIIITPHYAGATPHYKERAMAVFLANLRRYRAGKSLRNVVDKKLGY